MNFYSEKFEKERDEALLSLDKQKIISYQMKYGVRLPSNELAFWASIHKAILYIRSATPEQKARSEKWLIDHGFDTKINGLHTRI